MPPTKTHTSRIFGIQTSSMRAQWYLKISSPKQASKHFGIVSVHRQEDYLTVREKYFCLCFYYIFIDALNVSEPKGESQLPLEEKDILVPDETFEDSGRLLQYNALE